MISSPTPPLRVQILSTSISLTSNDRNKQYGDPKDQHDTAGAFIDLYFKHKKTPLSPAHDAALIMVLTKISRMLNGELKDDSYIDAAAYLAIAYECEARARGVNPQQPTSVPGGSAGSGGGKAFNPYDGLVGERV